MENYQILECNQVSTPTPINNTRRYEQKEDAICELISGSGTPLGTGFFCQTTINNKTMKFLFTCNHVLDKSKIKIDSTIQLKHKDTTKNIKITKNRFVCTNEELNYTCIEIFYNEEVDNYFQIDPNINCNNPNKAYKNELIAIMQYPGNKDLSIAEGKIIEIKENLKIYHSVPTMNGSAGSPIILTNKNLYIIGMHQGKSKDYKIGIYFKNVLEDLEKQYLKFVEK